jgi:hypothetical protein
MEHIVYDTNLLREGTEVNIVTTNGKTLFGYACEIGNTDACYDLLQNPLFNVNVSDNIGSTPLMYCIRYNYPELFVRILERGSVNLTQCNIYGNTALHLACRESHGLLFVQKLLDHFANINLTNQDGEIALHFAVLAENEHIISLLLKSLASPFVRNNMGKRSIDIAIEIERFDLMNLLVHKELFNSIKYLKYDVFDAIMELPGLDLNMLLRDYSNVKTPLILACEMNNFGMVQKIIIKAKKEFCILDETNVLFTSMGNYHDEITDYLIASGIFSVSKGINDIYFSNSSDKYAIIEKYIPRANGSHYENNPPPNDIYNEDGEIHENNDKGYLFRTFYINQKEYVYDILFLLRYWDHQRRTKSYMMDNKTTIYNFPVHTGTFFTHHEIQLFLQHLTTSHRWDVIEKSRRTIRPSSPGLNQMDNVPIHFFIDSRCNRHRKHD